MGGWEGGERQRQRQRERDRKRKRETHREGGRGRERERERESTYLFLQFYNLILQVCDLCGEPLLVTLKVDDLTLLLVAPLVQVLTFLLFRREQVTHPELQYTKHCLWQRNNVSVFQTRIGLVQAIVHGSVAITEAGRSREPWPMGRSKSKCGNANCVGRRCGWWPLISYKTI